MTKSKAYHRELCITPEQVDALPKVTPQLKEICESLKEKNLQHNFWYYLEGCGEPHVRKVMALRERVRTSSPTLEALCCAADVDPLLIFTAFLQTVDRLTNYSASVRLSSSKKEVTEALINSALIPGPDGATDRAIFMKATGLLPQPKGAQTVINMTQNSSTPTAVFVAPDPAKTIKRLSDRFNALQLPTPAEELNVFEEESPDEA